MTQNDYLSRGAKATATRKNNKVKKRYPLLAQAGVVDDWFTSAESEQVRIDRYRANHESWLEKRWISNQKDKALAGKYRTLLNHWLTDESEVERVNKAVSETLRRHGELHYIRVVIVLQDELQALLQCENNSVDYYIFINLFDCVVPKCKCGEPFKVAQWCKTCESLVCQIDYDLPDVIPPITRTGDYVEPPPVSWKELSDYMDRVYPTKKY